MEEIVNSTPVMLVYPKATSKNQVILVVFQHENKVNHGYTSNSAHIVWFAGIDLNGVLQWSQLLSGRTSVSSLAHPPGQSLREYFAEHKVFELHLAGMLALWWYQFSRFLSRPNGNFFNARKILYILWLKIHMNLIHFFAKFGKSPNLWGISMIFFCILQNPKIRKFFVQSQVTLLHLWLLRLDELLVFDSWQLHSFNPVIKPSKIWLYITTNSIIEVFFGENHPKHFCVGFSDSIFNQLIHHQKNNKDPCFCNLFEPSVLKGSGCFLGKATSHNCHRPTAVQRIQSSMNCIYRYTVLYIC